MLYDPKCPEIQFFAKMQMPWEFVLHKGKCPKKDKGKFDSLWSKSKCKTCFGGPTIDNDSEWFLKNYFVWYFKGVCLFVHFLKLEVSLLQDFERHRYVTLSWIEGNTGNGLLPIPSKDFPPGRHVFCKKQKLTKGHQYGFRKFSGFGFIRVRQWKALSSKVWFWNANILHIWMILLWDQRKLRSKRASTSF